MCSVGDADLEGETFMPAAPKIKPSHTCRKCEKHPSCVLLQKKDAYCRDCFLESTTHKFRSTLGKSKIMRASDKVLVAFSGSQASVALLHMLQQGFNAQCHKKFHFSVVVCFIDESGVLVSNRDDRNTELMIADIKKVLKESGFEHYMTSLSQHAVDSPQYSTDRVPHDEEKETQLSKLIMSVASLSAKEDLVLQLRHTVLYNMARHLTCNKVLTAEVGANLAVKLLTNVCLGRGGDVSLKAGFCDNQHSDILFLRPLRELCHKEVAYYNVLNNLSAVVLPSLSTLLPQDSSIRKLTEAFVTGLQEEFPSTVYTIFRTADKLTCGASARDEGCVCVLCGGLLQDIGQAYSAVKAVNFSRTIVNKPAGASSGGCASTNTADVSETSMLGDDKRMSCCGGGCLGSAQPLLTREELSSVMCYGCNLILKDMKSLTYFPHNVVVAARRAIDFRTMRNGISEYLLT